MTPEQKVQSAIVMVDMFIERYGIFILAAITVFVIAAVIIAAQELFGLIRRLRERFYQWFTTWLL